MIASDTFKPTLTIREDNTYRVPTDPTHDYRVEFPATLSGATVVAKSSQGNVRADTSGTDSDLTDGFVGSCGKHIDFVVTGHTADFDIEITKLGVSTR